MRLELRQSLFAAVTFAAEFMDRRVVDRQRNVLYLLIPLELTPSHSFMLGQDGMPEALSAAWAMLGRTGPMG